jgi:hypothetical protein
MSTSEGVQKRNAFAAFAAFRIEGLEASLNHAREIAVRDELDAIGHYIQEAQGYLAQIRVLHEEALLSSAERRENRPGGRLIGRPVTGVPTATGKPTHLTARIQ